MSDRCRRYPLKSSLKRRSGKWRTSAIDLKDFNDWLGECAVHFKHRVCIAGNHETGIDDGDTTGESGRSLLSNATYLQDSGVEVEGYKVYGMPWRSVEFRKEPCAGSMQRSLICFLLSDPKEAAATMLSSSVHHRRPR